METRICPKAMKFPIFNTMPNIDPQILETFRNDFCKITEEICPNCARYTTSEALMMFQIFVLPDVEFTVDEVLDRIENREE